MIAVVYGTRPEAIKLEPVVKALRGKSLDVCAICTGQHKELLDAVSFRPDIELSLMKKDQLPNAFVTKAVEALAEIFTEKSPDEIVVQGDTATAFSAALAAFHLKIRINHVEAGLRTYDLSAPFPEEGYRQMIDRVASRLFAPTESAKINLIYEGHSPSNILVTGNTGIDAALSVIETGKGKRFGTYPYMLVTLHRREAFGEPLASICRAIDRITKMTDLTVVLPVHPNPHASTTIRSILENNPKVELVEPLSYPDLIQTMIKAKCVLTDSGGIQEEAPTFGIPVFVARQTTERPEAVASGNAVLVGFFEDSIVSTIVTFFNTPSIQKRMSQATPLFGDGKASLRIAEDIFARFH
jgi:UDP-N-acetylglucosamine 2-epimerase (non-hydrolysing)